MLYALLAIAVALTFIMFLSRNMMLGFPSAMFWAIMGGHCYGQSTATWDIYYLLFFAAFGMAIFCMIAAYALRTKKEEAEEGDQLLDEGADKDMRFIDEKEERGISRRVRSVRDRARKRLVQGVQRRNPWGLR